MSESRAAICVTLAPVPPKPPPRPKKPSKPPRAAAQTTEIDAAWPEPVANETAKSRAKSSVPARAEPGQRRDTIPVQLEWLEFVEETPKGSVLLVPTAPPLPRPIPRPRRKASPPPLPVVEEKRSKRRSTRPKKTTKKHPR